MIANSLESDELNKNEMNRKKKIKLIIITKNGKSQKQKEKSKITLQNEKGRFEIRMENMTQTLNKNKIDKAVKSIIKNISDSSFDKNQEKIHTSVDNKRKQKKKILINDNNSNDYCDIYLEKKKKSREKNNNQQKNEEITGENILFKKLKIIEKEKESNLINTNNINANSNYDENNVIINDDLKESNRCLIKKNNIEDESINNKLSSKKEIESSIGVKNEIIDSNLNINNFFKDENKKKEKLINLAKNRETEENKNDINIYHVKDNINNNNLNSLNNLSRNVGRQLLTPQQNSETYNQSTNNFNKIEQNMNSNYQLNISNNLNIQIKHSLQRNVCSICEITYTSYAFFVAECNKHFLCKKCAKSFYEEKIETGVKELFCPFLFCNKKFSNNQAKKFLSKKHYNMLVEEEKNNNLNSFKLINNNNNNYKEMKNYSENHVLDINNNKIFYNFNKNKNIFCSRCKNETLFCRDKQLFMRCLYCRFAQCKYCFKEYTHDHFDMNSKYYCRIYYRDPEIDRSQTKINKYLIQLFLVFAIFFLSIISLWKVPVKIFANCFFKLNDNNNNCFLFYLKYIFIYIFTLIIFIICLPINIIMYPWFPSFLALFDY